MSRTINAQTDSVTAVWHACLGGKFRVRLTIDAGPGRRSGDVLDDAGNRIGDASDYIYGGRGFAVHTRPYGGFVASEQIEFVPTVPSGWDAIEPHNDPTDESEQGA